MIPASPSPLGRRSGEGALRRAGRDLGALLLPVVCAGCGRRDRACCPGCLAELLAAEQSGPPAARRLPGGGPVRAALGYRGVLARLIVAQKDRGRRDLSALLGALLAPAVLAALPAGERPALVPLPSRPESVRSRGYPHLELLLRGALRSLPRGALVPGGWRAMETLPGRRDQLGLSPAERAENARLLGIRPGNAGRLRGRAVILVDDVVTTGASLSAAERVLLAAGARVLGAAVCASAPRREHSTVAAEAGTEYGEGNGEEIRPSQGAGRR